MTRLLAAFAAFALSGCGCIQPADLKACREMCEPHRVVSFGSENSWSGPRCVCGSEASK